MENYTSDKISAMLNWKYGSVADTFDNKITAWRHPTIPQPDEKQIEIDLEEYKIALVAINQAKADEAAAKEVAKTALLEKLKLSKDEVELLQEILWPQ